MKIIRTIQGNIIIADNIVYVKKQTDYNGPSLLTRIIAIDIRGEGYVLFEEYNEADADKVLNEIAEKLSN